MPALFRKKEASEDGKAFLRAFLKYVTGLSYINKGNPCISIVFEDLEDEEGDESEVPESRICEQELAIPLNAYGASLELLEDILDEAMEQKR